MNKISLTQEQIISANEWLAEHPFASLNTQHPAAVSCSSVPYRLGAGGICFWDDGQAGPCIMYKASSSPLVF